MVKSAIKVVVRVRPTPDFASSAINLHADKKVRQETSQSPRFSAPFRLMTGRLAVGRRLPGSSSGSQRTE